MRLDKPYHALQAGLQHRVFRGARLAKALPACAASADHSAQLSALRSSVRSGLSDCAVSKIRRSQYSFHVSGVGSAGQGDKTAAGIQHGQDMLPENEGIPLGEELRRKKDIRHPPLRGRFKPVDGAAVDEQPAADFHAQPLGADQAVDRAGVDRDEFELPVPMPRDGLSAELIEIVVIILEREFRRAVRAQLPQGFRLCGFL